MSPMSKKEPIKSVVALFAALGGARGFSELIGVDVLEVRRWKSWGFVPPSLHYRTVVELKKHGLHVHPCVFDVPERKRQRRVVKGKAA